MSSRVLMFLLASAASIGVAQDIGVLNQGFQLHYNTWQLNQDPRTTSTQAVYDFTAGLPAMTYRLGAIALSGSMEYNRLTTGDASGSDLGLNFIGVRASLFPYRPFHVFLEYSRSETPGLLGAEKVMGNIVGAALNYRGQQVQDLQVYFRRGITEQPGESETWTQLGFAARQHYGNTTFQVSAINQEYAYFGDQFVWKTNSISAGTDTVFSPRWELRTLVDEEQVSDARGIGLGVDLIGSLGRLVSLTTMSMSQYTSPGDLSKSVLVSDSAILNNDRFSAFATAAFSKYSITSSLGTSIPDIATMQLGGAYSLSSEWRVSADVGLSSGGTSNTPDTNNTIHAHDTEVLHVGAMRGGDMPGLVKHALFYLSDQSFERQVQNDYPPGYLPTELSEQLLQRRLRQNGGFGFTADFWRMETKDFGTSMDWARITGDLKVGSSVQVLLIGDWKKDNGQGNTFRTAENKDLSLNGSYRVGATSVTVSVGYYKNILGLTSAGVSANQAVPLDTGTASYYSMGFNSRIQKMTYGMLLTRYDEGLHVPTNAFNAYATFNFRQVSMRVSYQVAERSDGFRGSRITVDLLRMFDSIALWGQK